MRKLFILLFFIVSYISFSNTKSETPKKHFSGFFVGGSIAYDYFNSGFVYSGTNNLIAQGLSVSQSIKDDFNNSGSFMARFGYDHKFENNFYAGVEMAFSFRFISSYKETITINNGAATVENTLSMPFVFALIGKFGYVIEEKNLLYVLFGYDLGLIRFSSTFFSNPTVSSNSLSTGVLNGFRFGAGYERILFSNESLDISGNFEAYYSEKYYIKTAELVDMNGINLNVGVKFRF